MKTKVGLILAALALLIILYIPGYAQSDAKTSSLAQVTIGLPVGSFQDFTASRFLDAFELRAEAGMKVLDGTLVPDGGRNQEWGKTLNYFLGLPKDAQGLDNIREDGLRDMIGEGQSSTYMYGGDQSLQRLIIQGTRRWLLATLVASSECQDQLVEAAVRAASHGTPDQALARKKKLLAICKFADSYLKTFDVQKEADWYAECQKQIKGEGQDPGYDQMQELLFRFNRYAPGEYEKGKAPDPMRWVGAGLYRRIVEDHMPVSAVQSCVSKLLTRIGG